jgi:outer membrane protein assembly factor BamB
MPTLIAFLLSMVLFAPADPDWPQFRGPDLNPVGFSKLLPDRWSKTENIEWTSEIPGRGWSSPIVTGGKIYVTAATTEGKSKPPQIGTEYSNEYAAELMKQGLNMSEVMAKVNERDIEMPNEVTLHYWLYCLDLKTGVMDWKKEFYGGHPPGGRHRKNSFTSETPVTDGQSIFVYVANLGIWAFDLKGKQLWTEKVETNPIYLDFGTGGSPVLAGNQLVILSDNEKQQYLAAFDKQSGKKLWRTNRDLAAAKGSGGPEAKSGWTTPFVWKNSQRTEIVTVGPGNLVSYDLEGKELWRMSGMSAAPIPSPFAYDGWLYVDAGRGRPVYVVKPGASGDISLKQATDRSNDFVVWSEAKAGTYLPTPVAYDGGLYVLNEIGMLTRLDLKTGQQSYKARLLSDGGAGAFTSSPWAYNGKVFCLSEEGKTYVVAAGEKFQLLHVNDQDEMAQATPAIIGDRLLLRTETKLYSIRQRPTR